MKFISQLNCEDERQKNLNLKLKATWNCPSVWHSMVYRKYMYDLRFTSISFSKKNVIFSPNINDVEYMVLHEPLHDKTNKMSVRPAKTQIIPDIRPIWSESSLSAWRKIGSLATHWAHSDDSDQTGQIIHVLCIINVCTSCLSPIKIGLNGQKPPKDIPGWTYSPSPPTNVKVIPHEKQVGGTQKNFGND